MYNSRIADVSCAAVVALISLLLWSQLANIPEEGRIFPMCVIYLLLGSSFLLAVRTFLACKEKFMFFGGIPVWRWFAFIAIYLVQILGAMYISFKLFMGLGMLTTLFFLEQKHSVKQTVINILFVACFLVFFHVFFTSIMHIYFPEPFFE